MSGRPMGSPSLLLRIHPTQLHGPPPTSIRTQPGHCDGWLWQQFPSHRSHITLRWGTRPDSFNLQSCTALLPPMADPLSHRYGLCPSIAAPCASESRATLETSACTEVSHPSPRSTPSHVSTTTMADIINDVYPPRLASPYSEESSPRAWCPPGSRHNPSYTPLRLDVLT